MYYSYKTHKTDDLHLRQEIEKELDDNDRYCPCQIDRSEDTKCMCKDFKDKLQDTTFFGPCICGLFIKEKV